MDAKSRTIADLSRSTALDVVSGVDKWLSFLNLMGRNYQLPFAEQILVFGQRPGATALSTLDGWRNQGRLIRGGSKAIAVLGEFNGNERLNYLFDITDTAPMRGTRPFQQWELTEAERMEALAGLPYADVPVFEERIKHIVQDIVQAYFDENDDDIESIILSDTTNAVGETGAVNGFLEFVTTSATYAVLSRAGGSQTVFDMDDFMGLLDYGENLTAAVCVGRAVSNVATAALCEIESGVLSLAGRLVIPENLLQNVGRTEETPTLPRQEVTEHGTDIQEPGRLPGAEPDGEQGAAGGQIRADAAGLPEREPPDDVRGIAVDAEAEQPPAADGRGRGPDAGTEHGAVDAGTERPGQSDRPAGLDGLGEQSETDGGGSSDAGIDLPLEEDGAAYGGGSSPTEEKREGAQAAPPSSIPGGSPPTPEAAGGDVPPAAALPELSEDEIRAILRYDKFVRGGKQGVIEQYDEYPDAIETRSNYLKLSYNGDFTGLLRSDGVRYGYKTCTTGDIEYESSLNFDGMYFWRGNFMSMDAAASLSWLEVQDHIDRMIANGTYQEDFNSYTGPGQGSDEMLDEMDEPEDAETAAPITNDDIVKMLCSGGGFAGSKMRINEFFLERHPKQDAVRFLKHEYGTGGGSFTMADGGSGNRWHDNQGLRLSRTRIMGGGEKDVHLKWPKVADELRTLVLADRYLTEEEKAHFARRQPALEIGRRFEEVRNTLPHPFNVNMSQAWVFSYELGDQIVVQGENYVVMAIDGGMVTLADPDTPLLSRTFGSAELEKLAIGEADNSIYIELVDDPDTNMEMVLHVGDTIYYQNNPYTIRYFYPDRIYVDGDGLETRDWLYSFDWHYLAMDSRNNQYLQPATVQEYIPSEDDIQLAADIHTILNSYGDYDSEEGAERKGTEIREIAETINDGLAYRLLWDVRHVFTSYPYKYDAIDAYIALNNKLLLQAGVVLETPVPEPVIAQDTTIDVLPTPPQYKVGDTVYLEPGKQFEITHIEPSPMDDPWDDTIKLHDLGFPLVNRVMYRREFDTLYHANPQNHEPVTEAVPTVPDNDVVVDDVFLLAEDIDEIFDDAQLDRPEFLTAGDDNVENIAQLLRAGEVDELLDILESLADTFDAETSVPERANILHELVREFGNPQEKEAPAHEAAEPAPRPSGRQRRRAEDEVRGRAFPSDIYTQILHDDGTLGPMESVAQEPQPAAQGEADTYTVEQISLGEVTQISFDTVPKYHEFDITVSDKVDEAIERTATGAPIARYPGETAKDKAAPPPVPTLPNYRITDDHLGAGGQKTRAERNMAAIQLAKEIEGGRPATPEDQDVLAQYVGWGGIPQIFDEENGSWDKEYHRLKNLLTDVEYKAARATTLNAHYTSPTVIRAIYNALEDMGFESGNVLEPAMGTGNFFGMMPESMREARLYGVELDPTTGAIAHQLYPQANIQVTGYENTNFPDAFFDVAIGNVPFGNYTVADARYDAHKFSIHDYFFAKTLDKVRPGGIIAFVTSKYTMDRKDDFVRRYLFERAELLGAIRLPSNAFKENAGTEVTTDILFLQRREKPIVIDEPWLHLGETEDGIEINRYFAENPQMVMGKMVYSARMYGDATDTSCEPLEGADLARQLQDAIAYIDGAYTPADPIYEGEIEVDSIPADPNVRNFSYTLVDGKVYYRVNSVMNHIETNRTATLRIIELIGLRDCVRNLIQGQLDDLPDVLIENLQRDLNRRYDAFVKNYGRVNNRGNSLAFRDDDGYYLLCSLEVLGDEGEFERKSDMFTKRTIRKPRGVPTVTTSVEALAVSISERARVDIPFMQDLFVGGKDYSELVEDLHGVIFHDPTMPKDSMDGWQTADEYLSGNVREKLKHAEFMAEQDPDYKVNAEYLAQVQPEDLDASEIEVRLGATWVPQEDIENFMFGLLDTPGWAQISIKVIYAGRNGLWNIKGKSQDSSNNVKANEVYGTTRKNAYQLIEDTLNLRATKVYDKKTEPDGSETRVLNGKETMLAQQKQEMIKQAFKDWVFDDQDRRERLVRKYNELFNSTRTREYDGSHIHFAGMSPEIILKEHQVNAVARILYGGNTLLAHVVGAGKTFEMVAAAMESKRLALCHKSLIVVPNHLVQQWAGEFLQLYPSAKLLVTTKKDFMTQNRKKFCGKIATGDYDAIIIGHSQFEKIPMSRERQIAMLEKQIDEIMDEIRELKDAGAQRFSVKQAEKTRKGLEARLKKLTDGSRKDDVVSFEELGVGRLFVDESHFYKNLFLFTKMRNVAGIGSSEAQKSTDLYMKCQYLDEITGYKGVVFATGTPISNSMVELYTMQRYLQTHLLERTNLMHFDSWASTFGETVTAIELAPEGTGFRPKTRFARFYNLPELMNMFRECADIQTADMLNLPVPALETGKPIIIAVEPTGIQTEMVLELADRAKEVRNGDVDPSVDNMLKITNDGRKLALDQRLHSSAVPDDPDSKLNRCIDNIWKIWDETREARSTQLVFCDLSTPKRPMEMSENPDTGVLEVLDTDEEDVRTSFNVYWDIKEKLVSRGMPYDEIAFIHDAKTDTQKAELFAKVRKGSIRVLIGSTFKMGAGMNVQTRLKALHHLDVPWRPSDIEQRVGRMVRQGNNNPVVAEYRYVTQGTFDAYSWGLIENKQKFISQIMTSKSAMRSCNDVDESVLSYAEVKALATGDPRIKEKFDLETELTRLKALKSNHQSQRYRLEDNLAKTFPKKIMELTGRISGLEKDIELLKANTPQQDDVFSMVVNDVQYDDKEKAGKALLMMASKTTTAAEPIEVGRYRGFSIQLEYDSFRKDYKAILIGALKHSVNLGTDAAGNITRLNNGLDKMEERLQKSREELEGVHKQVGNAQEQVKLPFPQQDELEQKTTRYNMLCSELDINDSGAPDVMEDFDEAAPEQPGPPRDNGSEYER